MKDRYSKLAFLYRVKEKKTPSLSTQASFALFFLKVAWSGKSLIDHGQSPWYKSDRALVNTLLDIGSSAGASCSISHRDIHSCSIYYL